MRPEALVETALSLELSDGTVTRLMGTPAFSLAAYTGQSGSLRSDSVAHE
jgi:hypothetical protein